MVRVPEDVAADLNLAESKMKENERTEIVTVSLDRLRNDFPSQIGPSRSVCSRSSDPRVRSLQIRESPG